MLNKLYKFSFGSTSAIITSMGLVVGLGSLNTGKGSILGSLMVIAVADNISDSLGIHIYQESEGNSKDNVSTTVSNFISRFVVSLSFVAIVLLLPTSLIKIATVIWGAGLLSVLTYFIAKAKGERVFPEVVYHLVVALIVVGVSQGLGFLIRVYF